MDFVRDDHGRVHVFLYPAITEGTKSLEDAIELGVVNDPRALLEELNLIRYFNFLVAYMQHTCLDGIPTFIDRLRVGKLRYFQRIYVGGHLRDSRFFTMTREVLKWGATVGFSGILLAIAQLGFTSKEPMLVEIAAEPLHIQQQRSEFIKIERENASRLEALERAIGGLQNQLNTLLLMISLHQLEQPASEEN